MTETFLNYFFIVIFTSVMAIYCIYITVLSSQHPVQSQQVYNKEIDAKTYLVGSITLGMTYNQKH